MSVEFHVETTTPPLTWEQFKAKYPVGSIALDGFVADGPRFDPEGPFLNVNHHENVDRLATLSTAQQIMMNIRMGMAEAFTKDGQFHANAYTNDCDQDIGASYYLLDNIEQVKKNGNPAINRFINVAGTLDVTAGAYPYDRNLQIIEELSWIFEPYTTFRANGGLDRKNEAEYLSIIEDVSHRIQKHLVGRGNRLPLDTRYETVNGGPGWSMIREIGKDGRVGAYIDGLDALIIMRQITDDRYFYSLWRRSIYIRHFPLQTLVDTYNKLEGCTEHCWGCGDTVGGCPRYGGSALPPDLITEETNKIIAIQGLRS